LRNKKQKITENKNGFPYSDQEILDFRDGCLSNIELRQERYKELRNILFNNEIKNHIFKTLEDIVSLIYLPDNIIFDIVPNPEYTIDDNTQKLLDKLGRVLSEKFIYDCLDIEFYEWLFWSFVYGSYIVKTIFDGRKINFKPVCPYDFAVYYEDNPNLDKDQVFCHIARIPLHLARKKYPNIELRITPPPSRTESFLDIVISQNQQTKTFTATPIKREIVETLEPKKIGEYAEIYELWMYDYDKKDWYMAQIIGDQIAIKSVNPFIPGEHPFIKFTPNPIEGYFWGLSELHFLTNLYLKIKAQVEKLDHIENMLTRPPLIVYGLQGQVASNEMQGKLQTPGEVIEIFDPTAKFDFYLPKLEPALVFEMIKYYEESFKEQSGIIGVFTGKPMANVRSASYASILAQFASTVLKKKALRTEAFLEEVMTTYANCIVNSRIEYKELLNIPFRVDVFAHTSSPITALAYQEMVMALAENNIIPPDVVIDMLPLPKKEKIKKFMATKALQEMQKEVSRETPKGSENE